MKIRQKKGGKPSAATTALQKAPSTFLVPSAGSLSAYIHAINQLPVLDAEEERALAVAYHKENNLEAAQKLVTHNLRFVVNIAKSYNGYGLALPDLIQEGNVGLMKAVKHFDPAKGVRLISFAVYWIRAEIHEFVIRNWRLVKVATTKAQRKLFFKLRSMKKSFSWLQKQEMDEIAEQLNVKPEEVSEMEKRMTGKDVHFDPSPGDKDENNYAPALYLSSDQDTPEKAAEQAEWSAHCRKLFNRALSQLDQRSLEIIRARWLNDEPKKPTLHELAEHYHVSAERVRQIESQAIRQLKEIVAAQNA